VQGTPTFIIGEPIKEAGGGGVETRGRASIVTYMKYESPSDKPLARMSPAQKCARRASWCDIRDSAILAASR